MPRRRLSRPKKLLFSGVVLLATLLLCELGLRLVWAPGPRFLGERLRHTGLFVQDEGVGWRMRPNQTLRFTWSWGATTTITTNGAGYRDIEHERPRDPLRLRVLILGDSHAFGFGVGDEDTVSAQLRRARPDLDVLNMAVTGYNLAQSRAVLEGDGRAYSPEVVVLTFVQNDVGHQRIPAAASHEQRREAEAASLKAFLSDHCYLYDFTRRRVSSSKPLSRLLVQVGLKDQLRGPEDLNPNLRPSLKEYPESLENEWDETLLELGRVAAACREISARFVVLVVPAKETVVDDALQASLAYIDLERDDFDLDKPYRALEAHCRAQSIICVNPLARFREASRSDEAPYLEHDMHISPAGHHLLAEALIPVLHR